MNKMMLVMDLIMIFYWFALTYLEYEIEQAVEAPAYDQ